MHWSLKVPYKDRAKRIASNFDNKQKRLEVNTQAQDTQNILLKILSRILIEKRMSLQYRRGFLMKENMLQYVCRFPRRMKNIARI